MQNKFGARYLRVSLLSACNLNCFYCRPSGQDDGPQLMAPYDKVAASIRLLYKLGIRKVRFTGGEPILYRRLPELLELVKELDSSVFTATTTNGTNLESLARPLAAAGLDSVNISLDTLDRAKFQKITNFDSLAKVKAGIAAATEHIGEVKLNCVLMRGVNDSEAAEMIAFADRMGVDIRFIEFMPNRHAAPGDARFMSGDELRTKLPYKLNLLPAPRGSAATYYGADDLMIRVGFINPVSHPFCAECDRLRLRADGFVHGCLFSPEAVNLYELLDQNIEVAQAALETVLATKRLDGCQNLTMLDDDLPSFLRLGG